MSRTENLISKEEALAQNPKNIAPPEVINNLCVLEVEYLNFDNELCLGQVVVNKKAEADVRFFFDKALQVKFPFKSVIPVSKYNWSDELSCADNNTSGYNYRIIAGTNRLSKHALGLALDVNPVENPFIKYDKNLKEIFRFPPDANYSPLKPGTLHSEHELVLLMRKLGWSWGGDWKAESGRIDYQHFEKEL